MDGWKLDGCDTLFSHKLGKFYLPFNRAHSGWMTTRQYMDHYAREEYRYGLSRNPEFITMIRAIDGRWTHPEGFAPLDAAPVTWVGDNQHTWKYKDRGIEAAISDILESARLGYCVVGSDIAGYHGHSKPEDMSAETVKLLSEWSAGFPGRSNFTIVRSSLNSSSAVSGPGLLRPGKAALRAQDEIAPNIYIRWAEFSAFCGFFLNGGHGERRLWKRTPPELEIVRKFSWLHTELVPYIYSHVVSCHNGGPPLMRPLTQGKFHYLFGDDFLVAPIHEDKLTRTVSLPAGRWRYFFADNDLIEGPALITRDFPLDEFPVFIREGAVVPLEVQRSYIGLGDKDSAGFRTWLVYPSRRSQFTLWHPETHPKPESTTVKVESGAPLKIQFSGKHEPHLLRILLREKPTRVMLDGKELLEGPAWKFDPKALRLIIQTRDYRDGAYVIEP